MQVVWSLNQLAAGKTFGFDAWGKEIPGHEPMVLAGGWRAIWSGMKGDQVYIKKALCLSTSWVSKEVCYHCKANQDAASPLLYTNHGRGAQHRQTRLGLKYLILGYMDPKP